MQVFKFFFCIICKAPNNNRIVKKVGIFNLLKARNIFEKNVHINISTGWENCDSILKLATNQNYKKKKKIFI